MKKINKLRQDGFTLIEILMAVLIIGILAAVGITQFSNFASDAKNAATKSNLAILRNGISAMNALERTRCNKTSALFPDISLITENDITDCTTTPAGTALSTTKPCTLLTLINPNTGAVAAGTCTTGVYLSLMPYPDRAFVQNGIPSNPWQGPNQITAKPNSVTASVVTAGVCEDLPAFNAFPRVNGLICGSATPGVAYTVAPLTDVGGGWCYCQQTGQIWANTANNDGASAGTGTESTF